MPISIVIATYNRAPLLASTLASLRCQDYGAGDEVIVVDNGSTDTTADVIARAALEFPIPVRTIREPAPGKTAALIAGLRMATGDVFALTDDDVLVSGNWVATIRHLFTDPALALVGGRVDPLWEASPPTWLAVDEANGRYGAMCSPLALLHYGGAQAIGARTAVGANMAVRRGALDALGGFAPHLGRHRGTLLCGEDHDLTQRAVAAGLRCEYRPELRVRHRVPAERTRLRYFLRWFFWSGITHALLDDGDADMRVQSRLPLYFVRRLVVTTVRAAAAILRGRQGDAAASAMEAAFAAGYLWQRMRRVTGAAAPAGPRYQGAAVRGGAGVHG